PARRAGHPLRRRLRRAAGRLHERLPDPPVGARDRGGGHAARHDRREPADRGRRRLERQPRPGRPERRPAGGDGDAGRRRQRRGAAAARQRAARRDRRQPGRDVRGERPRQRDRHAARDAARELVRGAGRLPRRPDAVHRRGREPRRPDQQQVESARRARGRRADLPADRRRAGRSGRRRLDQRHRFTGADAMKRAAVWLLCLFTLAATAPALASDAAAAGGLSKLPKQVVFVEAAYPPGAAAAGVEADVILDLTIDATGHVSHAGVATSAGPGREAFDAAAVAAATGYLFEPAESDGQPVPVELAYKVKFRLHAKAPAPPPPTAQPGRSAAPVAAPRPRRESLAGLLRERGTRSPLIGVVVTASNEGSSPPQAYEATSDGNGRFAFFDLLPGTWRLDVEAPAYFPFRTSEEVRAGEKTVVTYYVERGQGSPLDETVTAARPKKDVTHVVLTAEVIDKVPGTAGDPLAVLQDLAGVARAPAGSGLLIVRGSAPEDTQIFVDGMDVPLVYHFGGLRSVLPEGVIDNIEFVPGNFSPEYGRATGGIVDVHLKELKPKRFGGYLDVSVLDAGLYLEWPLGNRGGVAVAVRRSYLDLILKAAVPSDASVSLVTAPVYYDAQLLANYRLTPAHDLRAMAFAADDRLAVLFKDPADFSQQATGNQLNAHTGFWRGLVADHYTPREGLENTLRLSAGQDGETISEGDLVLDLHRMVVQLRDTLRLRLRPWPTLSAGTDAVAERYSGHVHLPPPPEEGQPVSNQDLNEARETFVTAP